MTVVEALQRALAAEHQAVYLYEYAGGRAASYAGKGLAKRLYGAWSDHQELRTWLETTVSGLGAHPVAAELVYPTPNVTTVQKAKSVAKRAERDCLIAWLEVVAAADPGSEIRSHALTCYSQAGLRGVSFGARPQALPGLGPDRTVAARVSQVGPSPASS